VTGALSRATILRGQRGPYGYLATIEHLLLPPWTSTRDVGSALEAGSRRKAISTGTGTVGLDGEPPVTRVASRDGTEIG
jgi:hypothetical protein